MTKREHKTYTLEFKREAVRMAEASDLPMTQIARQLGIHRNMLANWRKALSQTNGKTVSGSQVDSQAEAELVQLRQEVELLRREREILKKALAIISREQA